MVLFVAALVIAADQLTKYLVKIHLSEGASIPLIGNILRITHVRNPGAAFGMLPNMQVTLIIASAVFALAIAVYYFGHRHLGHGPLNPIMKVALGLELGGAIGNLIDRLLIGRVTDFIDVRIWPVFNLADTAVVCGAALLVAGFALSKRAGDIRRTEVGD